MKDNTVELSSKNIYVLDVATAGAPVRKSISVHAIEFKLLHEEFEYDKKGLHVATDVENMRIFFALLKLVNQTCCLPISEKTY